MKHDDKPKGGRRMDEFKQHMTKAIATAPSRDVALALTKILNDCDGGGVSTQGGGIPPQQPPPDPNQPDG